MKIEECEKAHTWNLLLWRFLELLELLSERLFPDSNFFILPGFF